MQKAEPPFIGQSYPGCRDCIRQAYRGKNLSDRSLEILVSSIAESTVKQYNTALKYWWTFCLNKRKDPYAADEETIICCLTLKFDEGACYGTLNTLRSAIALINNNVLSDTQLMKRFFKGVFKLRPIKTKYSSTWDVSLVLDLLESWGSLQELSLEKLSYKTVMLLALASAFRVQSLALIKLNNLKKLKNGVEIKILDLIKTSKPGANQPYAFFPYFKDRPLVCVASTLLHYCEKTC